MGMVEMKNIVVKISNMFSGLTASVNSAKKRISELEDQLREITHFEIHREKLK